MGGGGGAGRPHEMAAGAAATAAGMAGTPTQLSAAHAAIAPLESEPEHRRNAFIEGQTETVN